MGGTAHEHKGCVKIHTGDIYIYIAPPLYSPITGGTNHPGAVADPGFQGPHGFGRKGYPFHSAIGDGGALDVLCLY